METRRSPRLPRITPVSKDVKIINKSESESKGNISNRNQKEIFNTNSSTVKSHKRSKSAFALIAKPVNSTRSRSKSALSQIKIESTEKKTFPQRNYMRFETLSDERQHKKPRLRNSVEIKIESNILMKNNEVQNKEKLKRTFISKSPNKSKTPDKSKNHSKSKTPIKSKSPIIIDNLKYIKSPMMNSNYNNSNKMDIDVDFDKDIAKQFKHINYCVINKDNALLFLKVNEKIIVRGYCMLTILKGSMHCYGIDLNASNTPIPLYSERSTFYQQLTCINSKDESSHFPDFLEKHENLNDLRTEDRCILLLTRQSENLVNILRCCQGISSLFRGEDTPGLQIGSLPLSVLPESCERVFNQSSEFSEIDFNLFKRMIFCGGVGSGKSTMTKYAINKLLSCGVKEVAYLDFDLGQSELGPGAFMSLHVVDRPLIGLRMTHLRKPHMAHYYGNTNPSNIELYITQVESLSKTALRMDMPLVVNTCGWIENLGIELLMHVIQCTNPDAVFQLRKSDGSLPKTLMDKHYVNEFIYRHKPSNKINVDFVHWDNIAFKSKIHHQDIGGLHLSSKTKRLMSLAAYFSPCFTSTNCQNTFCDYMTYARPYNVPWSAIVFSSDYNLQSNQIMNVLNCRLVGLSTVKDFEFKINGRRSPVVINKLTIETCISLGLGFIRGIDFNNQSLEIVTPLTQQQLSKVNCIQVGTHVTPDEILMSPTEAPYNGYPVQTSASSANVNRRSKPRSPKPQH